MTTTAEHATNSSAAAGSPSVPPLFEGSGDVRRLMRACDWSRTPLGSPDTWPQGLQAVVRVMLTSRFAMWMAWGPELTFLCNDAYLPTVGIKRDWVIGSRSDRVWAEIWPDIGPRIERVLTTGEATWDEALLLYLERSGFSEETYHTFSYSPLADDAGRTAGMLCVVAEVTEKVIGERQLAVLRDLGARLAGAATRKDVMEALEGCLAAEDRDMPFALACLFDGTGAAISATHNLAADGSATDPRLVPTNDWPFLQIKATGTALQIALDAAALDRMGYRGPGQPPQDALLLPIRSAEGAGVDGVLVAGISAHRNLDASYRGFLDLFVGQISAAISRADDYERERERAKALAELDRAKTAFFSNVSHEFRTPLTLMLGPLEDVLSVPDTPAQARENVEIAHRNALRLLRLVNSLLDFSRIEAGRVQASFGAVDLAQFTSDLASSFRAATQRAGLDLVVNVAPTARQAYVDRDMWEKIVLNLLSNAFKYTFDGAIEVHLEDHGHEACLIVRDTGTGIAEAELPRLFERFHRVEGARGRSFEGSGIGLALVHELVKQHGGRIDVTSRLGEGSQFVVTLPLGRDHLPADRIGAAADAPATAIRAQSFVEEALRWLANDESGAVTDDAPHADPLARGSSQTAQVLVADDNADLRSYMARLLASAGYRVETVENGEIALQRLRKEPYDLLITDVMMPRLDGVGLVRAIRADEGLREIPVIMLSARAGEEARIEGLEVGASDYLTKPFPARELLARVGSNISLARVRREARDALKAMNDELEDRVAKAIAAREHVEESLRQSQKMEAVGQLTGGVAHDFNNLLTIIGGNIDIARRAITTSDTGRIARALDNAQRGAERASSLTQRLLAFSRRQPLAPKPVHVDALVSNISELLHRALGETVRLDLVSEPGLWRIEADPNQLENAILNLALNARDAMPAGGRLTIETANARVDGRHSAAHADVAPGHYVVIAVTDTGHGMSRDTLARVFDPFFTTKEVGKGTGLGLSMVYGFVKQSGGHVQLHSEPDRGTSVRMYLPRLIGNEDADLVRAESADGGKASRNACILVVEDDDDVRAYTVEILRELGYRVLEAHDGPSALRLLENQERTLDLLFTDVVMPGMSGRELADKAVRARPGLRVLYTSGYTRDTVVHDGRLDEGVELIGKPFTYHALSDRIGELLDSGRTQRILLVEPDPTLRMFAVETLEALGYAVDQASSTADANRQLSAGAARFDAVLIEYRLPDGSALALADQLRAREGELPILFIDADAGPELAGRYATDPKTASIPKPFNATRLQRALEEIGLRRRRFDGVDAGSRRP